MTLHKMGDMSPFCLIPISSNERGWGLMRPVAQVLMQPINAAPLTTPGILHRDTGGLRVLSIISQY